MTHFSPTPWLEAFFKNQLRSYGFTDNNTLDAIRRLNSLPAADLSKLDPEDKQCIICRAYGEDEQADKTYHQLLRLPCGHVLGKSCLHIWMSPVHNCYLSMDSGVARKGRFFNVGSNTCLFCSSELYPAITNGTDILIMRTRLRLWDSVYTCFNIPLTDKDKEVRSQLTQYSATQFEIEEHTDGLRPWVPIAVHRHFFAGVCQFMVLYAQMLITHPQGCSEQNWNLAQAFLKHYRDVTAPGNYNAELWFNPHPELDQKLLESMDIYYPNPGNHLSPPPPGFAEAKWTAEDAWITSMTYDMAKKIYIGFFKSKLPMP